MNKAEFKKLTGLSVRSVRRKCEEALQNGGSFYVNGFGYFDVFKTGPHKNSPLEIEHRNKAKNITPPPEFNTPPPTDDNESQVVTIGGKEFEVRSLKDQKTLEEIKKLQMQTAEGEARIREDCVEDMAAACVELLNPLRKFLLSLNLNQQQIDELKICLETAAEEIIKIRLRDLQQ